VITGGIADKDVTGLIGASETNINYAQITYYAPSDFYFHYSYVMDYSADDGTVHFLFDNFYINYKRDDLSTFLTIHHIKD